MSAENQNKFGSIPMEENDESFFDTLPESVAKRVYGLNAIQAEQYELEKQFHAETHALEKKYSALFQPILEKRTAIVSGATEPSAEQIAEGKKIADADEEGLIKKGPKPDVKEIKGIPEFWLTAFKNNFMFAEIITERDEEALTYLNDVRVEYLDQVLGYKLVFEFNENEYFNNKQLTKTYHYKASEPLGAFVLDTSEGSEIEWKEGKDLTVVTKARKQRNKDTNQTRVIKTTEPTESFFDFFAAKNFPAEDEEGEPEELEDLESAAERDFDLSETLKDKIIPHAVDWYTGKAEQYDGMDFDPEDFDHEGYEYASSDDEGQIEEVEDEETIDPKGEQAPECKQQ